MLHVECGWWCIWSLMSVFLHELARQHCLLNLTYSAAQYSDACPLRGVLVLHLTLLYHPSQVEGKQPAPRYLVFAHTIH